MIEAKKSILGIDLGTSSVKLLKWDPDGTVKKGKAAYEGKGCEFWLKALHTALKQIDVSQVGAVGLSSQVGTYIVNDRHIIGWDSPEGKEELAELLTEAEADKFLKEISMPHPMIQSYPIPRLKYIKKHFSDSSDGGIFKTVCQPKDFLCEMLTGNRVTDPYSWRGLANLETGQYSEWGLRYAGVEKSQLPPIRKPQEMAGRVTFGRNERFKDTGLREGTPVYVGCNDFFAGLLGMGIKNEIFDITGTSEHIGILSPRLAVDTSMVSGPYFKDFVHYGVTASSGASMEFCRKNFPSEVELEECIQADPPIFLPYLNGERAPIWDPDASGVFFGIHKKCEKRHLAYAVMEGLVFSLYQIYEQLSRGETEGIRMITAAGGGAGNRTLNTLKAEMFGMPVKTLKENDTSALGAVMIAATAEGVFESLDAAAERLCEAETVIYPSGKYRDVLMERFEIYKRLYPSLKSLFAEKRKIGGNQDGKKKTV